MLEPISAKIGDKFANCDNLKLQCLTKLSRKSERVASSFSYLEKPLQERIVLFSSSIPVNNIHQHSPF